MKQKKCKIGILTFHNTLNYGASLQAYALCKYLRKIGADAEIIDYYCSAVENQYKTKINHIIFGSESLKVKLKELIILPGMSKRRKEFNNFLDKYVSEKKYNKLNIYSAKERYNYFIVGSDQIWNLDITNDDMTFFIDFTDDGKKISYAASIGNAEKIVKNKQVETLIKKFDSISLREKSARKYISDFYEKEIYEVIDPTFLLNKDEWLSIEKPYSKLKTDEKYILVYAQGRPVYGMAFAKQLAKAHGYKVVVVHSFARKFNGAVNIRDASLEEFIWLIHNAEYVITTSFHGIAFSLNLEKQFFVEIKDDRNPLNSRFSDLLAKVGLDNRYIDGTSVEKRFEDIDYREVKDKIYIFRENSRNFLQENLKG